MINLLATLVLLALLFGAGSYVYRAKKRGVKCIGCPAAGRCPGSCDCGHKDEKQ